MDNKKKNGLIRALGKLGRKVKFLQKPLMVLVVVGVSIHHLFRQFFFDVRYHSVRMRALMGAMCAALLLTLFVIPAIADEVFQLSVEYETLDTVEEATPTPLPEEEIQPQTEEPETEVEVVPENDQQPTADQGEGDQSESEKNDTVEEEEQDPEVPSADEGVTYDVDDDGNLIDDQGNVVRNVNKSSIAVRALNGAPEAPSSVTISPSGISDVNNIYYSTSISGLFSTTATFASPVSGKVVFTWETRSSGLTEEPSGDYTEIHKETKTVSSKSEVGSEYLLSDLFTKAAYVGGDRKYEIRCGVQHELPASEGGGSSAPVYKSTFIKIKKIKITQSMITLPTAISDGEEYVTVGGIKFGELKLDSELDADSSDLKDNLSYVLKEGSVTKATVSPGEKCELLPLANNEAYGVYVKFTDASKAKNYALDTAGTDISKGELLVKYYTPSDGESFFSKPTLTRGAEAPSTSEWYKAVTTTPKSLQSGDKYQVIKDGGSGHFELDEQTITFSHDTQPKVHLAYSHSSNSYVIEGEKAFSYTEGTKTYTKYNIDNTDPDPASIEFTDFSGGYYTNTDINFKVTASDAGDPTAVGVSGVYLIECKASATPADDGAITQAAWNSASVYNGNSSTETSSTTEQTLSTTGKITLGTTNVPGTVYLYAKVTDYAGNTSYACKKFNVIDKDKPTFSCAENSQLNTLLADESKSTIDVYMLNGETLDIDVKDPYLSVVQINDSDKSGEITGAEGTENRKYPQHIDCPAKGNDVTYKIYAKDMAGNERTVTIKVCGVEFKINKGNVNLGKARYGYKPAEGTSEYSDSTHMNEEEDEPVIGMKYQLVGDYKTDNTLGIKIDSNSIALSGDNADKFETPTVETIENAEYLLVKPKEKLDVGVYKAIVKFSYNFDILGDAVVVGKHSGSLGGANGIEFEVVPTPLYMKYEGSTEFYHTRPGDGKDAATGKWFDRLTIKDGLKYDDTFAAVQENGSYTYTKDSQSYGPTYTLTATDDGLTTDQYLIGDCNLTFTITGGAASKNYKYAVTDSAYTVVGPATVSRRKKEDGSPFVKGTAYEIDGEQVADRPDQEHDWYVKKPVKIKAMSGYAIMGAGEGTYDASKDETGGTSPTQYDVVPANAWSAVSSEFSSTTELTHETESNAKTGVIKYFYVFNETTGEVSDLITEVVLIDTSAPGTSGRPEEKKPSFNLNNNVWAEFFNGLTLKLFFNNMVKITVNNKDEADYQSDVWKMHYYISRDDLDEDTVMNVQERPDEGDAGTSGWTEFQNNETISVPQGTMGKFYIRLTNGAGLRTFLSTDKILVFDGAAPKIYGDGEDFTTGAEYVQDKLTIRVEDTNLHTTEDASDWAVRVYEGTDITNDSRILDHYTQLNPPIGTTTSGKELIEFDVELETGYPRRTYTVVAIDDSGFKTVKSFTLIRPVYLISVEDFKITDETYGYSGRKYAVIKWKNARAGTEVGNADLKAEDITITFAKGGSDFTAERDGATNEWRVYSKEKLKAGSHTCTIQATYTKNGKTRTAEAVGSFYVAPKKLTASYAGCSIARGATPTNTTVEVTGFAYDEGSRVSELVAAGEYVAPVVRIPANLTTTTLITPEGGKARNYTFEYVSGFITVETRKATQDVDYVVEGTLSSTGWYTSDIVIRPAKSGYTMTADSGGRMPYTNNRITINLDTASGKQSFYIREDTSGELMDECIFNYRRDTVTPVITGIDEGMTYKANKKPVTITDDNLASVTVNGIRQTVSNGRSTFDLIADQKSKVCFVVAQDYAGHTTSRTVTLLQEEGDEEGVDPDGDDYNPSDDMIQDDTDDGNDGDIGTLTKKVQLVNGAPSTTFTSTNKELKSYVLNASERSVMKEGSDANVKLRVANIDGSVNQSDKELVIAALGDYTVIQYLDITLWKTVGSGDENQVSQTKSPISVSITIPSKYRYATKAKKKRQFAIVRVHGDAATVLEDKDSSDSTVTVSTSKFSVYALAYRDVDASKASNSSSGGGKKSGNSSGGGSKGTSGSGSGGSGGSGSSGGSGGSSGGGSYSSGGRSSGYGAETDAPARTAPQTGDRAPILPTAIGFGVALIGMIAVIIIRRKLDYEWVYVGEDGKYYDEAGHLIDDDEIIDMN